MKTNSKGFAIGSIVSALICFAASITTASADQDDSYNRIDYRSVGAATLAKEVCSAVFVSGFDAQQHLENSAKFWLANEDRAAISAVKVDSDERLISLKVAGESGAAVFLGAQGCVALGPTASRPSIAHAPLPPVTLKPDTNWPIGDKGIPAPLPELIPTATMEKALRAAFAEDAYTSAFLVIHRGKVIAEKYDRGVNATTRLPGWSIAKTLQATIVGRLEQQQRISLFKPIPATEWSSEEDSRRDTTMADLLRMSAPISCNNNESWHDQQAWPKTGYPESFFVFSGPADVYSYSMARPPLSAGEPRGVYTNCQPMIVGKVLQDLLARDGQSLNSYAETALYTPLGMSPVIIEPDRSGNPLTAGYALATARDWARLGLLYANEGMWGGERLLSMEFMAFVRAPAPHWKEPIYGGQVWLNAKACLFDQCDAYQFNGIEGQRVVIFPSLDLVVARFGFGQGDVPNPDPSQRRPAIEAMNNAIQIIVDALSPPPKPEERSVKKTLVSFFSALRDSDEARFKSVLTDDFRLLEDGEVWSADYTYSRAARPDRDERWTITQARINIVGDIAYADYRNTGSFSDATGRSVYEWLESAVLVRDDTKTTWRIKLLHSSPVSQVKR